jgi:hypothetical protein
VPKSAKGVTTRDYPTMDGTRASEVYFENVAVGAEALVGAADGALPLIERLVDEANAAYCSEAVGCMRMMTDLTREYAKTRKQFGRPIAEFQVLQHRMVDMFMATEESYSMALLATIKLAADEEERARSVAAAKVAIGKHGRFVGQAAVQTHGGMGVTDEMRVGHYFKRVTMLDDLRQCRLSSEALHPARRLMASSPAVSPARAREVSLIPGTRQSRDPGDPQAQCLEEAFGASGFSRRADFGRLGHSGKWTRWRKMARFRPNRGAPAFHLFTLRQPCVRTPPV